MSNYRTYSHGYFDGEEIVCPECIKAANDPKEADRKWGKTDSDNSFARPDLSNLTDAKDYFKDGDGDDDEWLLDAWCGYCHGVSVCIPR